jgi:ribosomal protein S18 acetylase RimI-like enzyme
MRQFSTFDVLKFNNVNLDPLTETYNMSFYLQYLARWPEFCFTAEAPTRRAMGCKHAHPSAPGCHDARLSSWFGATPQIFWARRNRFKMRSTLGTVTSPLSLCLPSTAGSGWQHS